MKEFTLFFTRFQKKISSLPGLGVQMIYFYNKQMIKPVSFFLLLLPFLTAGLNAQSGHRTIYTEDRYFLTTGTLVVRADSDRINSILMNTGGYSEWALQGMRREDPGTEKLPALLVDAWNVPSDTDERLMRVSFDLNRFLKKRGISTLFAVDWTLNEQGMIDYLLLDYRGTGIYLKEASYSFFLTPVRAGIQIDFKCRVRLARLLDFFFTTRAYERNMAYYIDGLSANLERVLNE